MRHYATRFRAALLALAMLLSAAACSNQNTAAAMHLRRAEGTVAVSDSGGKNVPVLENLGLYSGYGVNTRSASYAWIDLDEVKLAKMDQNSEISIEKEGKALDIELKSGSLFFNVTEPLADDETMNIRTSTMLVGIRGTSGWVEENGGLSRVYILEGKVECSAEGQTVQVNAGEFAELTADEKLVVEPFTQQDIPSFVRDEPDAALPGGADETPGPEGSEAPKPTEAPAPTEPPEPSDASETTDAPETSDAPETTDAPEPSDTPEPTPELTLTPTPTPTSTPELTPTPTPAPTTGATPVLELIIQDYELVDDEWTYYYDSRYFFSVDKGIHGHFSFSRELTEQELESWSHGGEIYSVNGDGFSYGGEFFADKDGVFAVNFPEDLPKGDYVYVLYILVNHQLYEARINFTIS